MKAMLIDENREIVPMVYKVLPIEKAAEAHSILVCGENVCKAVLTVCK